MDPLYINVGMMAKIQGCQVKGTYIQTKTRFMCTDAACSQAGIKKRKIGNRLYGDVRYKAIQPQWVTGQLDYCVVAPLVKIAQCDIIATYMIFLAQKLLADTIQGLQWGGYPEYFP